ncbi:MAG: hypothetical protein ACO1O1_08410 [Adhaeribacter sp.]
MKFNINKPGTKLLASKAHCEIFSTVPNSSKSRNILLQIRAVIKTRFVPMITKPAILNQGLRPALEKTSAEANTMPVTKLKSSEQAI